MEFVTFFTKIMKVKKVTLLISLMIALIGCTKKSDPATELLDHDHG